MGERVRYQVRQQLAEPTGIAADLAKPVQIDVDLTVRVTFAQFIDNLKERWPEGHLLDGIKRNAAAEATARKVEHIVDQPGHPPKALSHEHDGLKRPFSEALLFDDPQTCIDRGKRVPQ